MASANKHLQELLRLPIEDRAYAARRLLESLDDEPPDSSAEELRAAERLRRAIAVADGTAEAVDEDEVRRRIAARVRGIRDE
jgi:hypothetical protein